MKVLNLTPGFQYSVGLVYDEIEYEYFMFPGGEPHIKIPSYKSIAYDDILVVTRLKSMEDLGKLMVAMDVLNYKRGGRRFLYVPYIPGARQDRRTTPGEPVTAKVFADVINSMMFDEVETFDAHSDVITGLIDNCESITNHDFIGRVVEDLEDIGYVNDLILVTPDGGAIKKGYELNRELMLPWVQASKHRDMQTGHISCMTVNIDHLNCGIEGQTCLVVDDICDGGRTFTELAKVLIENGAAELYLAVSHGIFSKGFKELNNVYDGIYTTDTWRTVISEETPEIERGSEQVTIMCL